MLGIVGFVVWVGFCVWVGLLNMVGFDWFSCVGCVCVGGGCLFGDGFFFCVCGCVCCVVLMFVCGFLVWFVVLVFVVV